MFNFLLRLLIVLTICCPEYLFASTSNGSLEPDEKDLELSKRSFLISGAPYEDIKNSNKGVMTLCSKEVKGAIFDHTSLVFEMFLPKNPHETYLTMIHFGREDDCCGFGGTEKIMLDEHSKTLFKIRGGVEIDPLTYQKQKTPASYIKYASWIISNDDLIKAFTIAREDKNTGYSPGNCTKYIKRIMETAGLENVNFGFWSTTASNLKILADEYIRPKYDIKH